MRALSQNARALLAAALKRKAPPDEGGAEQKAGIKQTKDTVMLLTKESNADAGVVAISKPSIRRHGQVIMSPDEWATVWDNPRQRDTEGRARRATHLLVPRVTHAEVQMARLPDGRRYKLDGHTRSYLWQSGKVAPPPMLFVTVYDCDDYEDVVALYRMFDSKEAVEVAQDRMFGAKREAGIEFESPWLNTGRYAKAVTLSFMFVAGWRKDRTDIEYPAVRYWAAELRQIDLIRPTATKFPTGVLCAALCTIARYGAHDVLPFWDDYQHGRGVKDGDFMSPVQALDEMVLRYRAQKRLSSGMLQELWCRSVVCAQSFRNGERYSTKASGPKALNDKNFRQFLTEVAREKEKQRRAA